MAPSNLNNNNGGAIGRLGEGSGNPRTANQRVRLSANNSFRTIPTKTSIRPKYGEIRHLRCWEDDTLSNLLKNRQVIRNPAAFKSPQLIRRLHFRPTIRHNTTMASEDPSVQPILLALPSFSPSLAVEALPFGFHLHKILVNGDGKTHDLLIGAHDPAEYKKDRAFINCIVGRYSNRIPAGEHKLGKGGYSATATVESTESPQVNLHGGADGFDRRVFDVVNPADSSAYSLFSEAEKQAIQSLPSSAIFKLTSPDGDQGFPGKLDVEVLLALVEPGTAPKSADPSEIQLGSILIVYRAKLADGQPKTVTPVNLTQHWGFNLDASLATPGGPTPEVRAQNLTIKAPNTINLAGNLLATGDLNPTTEDSLHNHNAKLIGEKYPDPRGYDQFYLFDKQPQAVPLRVPLSSFAELDVISPLTKPTDAVDEPYVALASKQSGIRITFDTNQPGVQFYTGGGLRGQGSRKKIHGGSGEYGTGDGYQTAAAAFLEFHEPLAAWLHPWGKDGNDTLLTSDELYNNYTKTNIYFKRVN